MKVEKLGLELLWLLLQREPLPLGSRTGAELPASTRAEPCPLGGPGLPGVVCPLHSALSAQALLCPPLRGTEFISCPFPVPGL